MTVNKQKQHSEPRESRWGPDGKVATAVALDMIYISLIRIFRAMNHRCFQATMGTPGSRMSSP